MNTQIGMISLGCSKNQVDAEKLLEILRCDGFEISGDIENCDVIIVNTCGFIEDAKKESIEHIMEAAQYKENGTAQVLVVTGCLAERYREELANEMPEVDVVLGIGKNADIADAVRRALGGETVISFGEKEALHLEGGRVLTTAPYTAYLKVAEGCGNRCSYCAIPLIRGDFRSRKMEDIIAEAASLAEGGVTELNLVAQDTTRYGEDLYGNLRLPELLTKLCGIEKLHWIRVLYCYPKRVTPELLRVMASEPKIVPYMDMPVQHSSGRILAAMNRSGDAEQLAGLIGDIRRVIPNITLRTTIITGFPGETERDFEELCEFVKAMKFDRLGCFTYSQEEDTPAAEMTEQIDEDVKRRRAEIIMETQMNIALEKGKSMIGETPEVLCEGFDRDENMWYGRSAADAPDVDTKVYFVTESKVSPGEYVQIKISDCSEYDLIGDRV